MEYKIEEMEAGYDRLIELDPGNEKKISREEKRGRRHRSIVTRPAITSHCTLPRTDKSKQIDAREQGSTSQDPGGTKTGQAENGLHTG